MKNLNDDNGVQQPVAQQSEPAPVPPVQQPTVQPSTTDDDLNSKATAIARRFADKQVEELKAQLAEAEEAAKKAADEVKAAEERGRLSVKREQYAKEMNTKPEYLEGMSEEQLEDLHSGIMAGIESREKIVPMQSQEPTSLVGW